jgi:NAD(P)-dependent dehydrogenase (short-subunit alcohol dehydrogenase family)
VTASGAAARTCADASGPAPLAGRVALVVGANRGIGRAYALALARAGAGVIATARTVGPVEAAAAGGAGGAGVADGAVAPPPGSLAEVLAAIGTGGGTGWALPCDLTDVDSIDRMVHDALAAAGRIDVLVNNAGVFPHHDSLAITPAEWDGTFDVNVRGPYCTPTASGEPGRATAQPDRDARSGRRPGRQGAAVRHRPTQPVTVRLARQEVRLVAVRTPRFDTTNGTR